MQIFQENEKIELDLDEVPVPEQSQQHNTIFKRGCTRRQLIANVIDGYQIY